MAHERRRLRRCLPLVRTVGVNLVGYRHGAVDIINTDPLQYLREEVGRAVGSRRDLLSGYPPSAAKTALDNFKQNYQNEIYLDLGMMS